MRVCVSILTLLIGCLAGLNPFSAGGQGSAWAYEGNLTLNAVFQSKNGGMALIDGMQYRPGDRVGGAEILAIERGAIRLQTGDGEYTAWVGLDLPQDLAPLPAREPRRLADAPASDPAPVDADTAVATHDTHTVSYGDTLSAIASRYRPDGMPLNEAISAILAANTDRIGKDMHTIYAGSTLMIPLFGNLPAPTQQFAGEKQDSGKSAIFGLDEPSIDAKSGESPVESYGPVEPGDTLSSIAQRLKAPGVTNAELMDALFTENPDAFGGSKDLLFAGAILQIPSRVWLPAGESTYTDALASVQNP